ncbi:MAG: glycosyltransferase family 2 protein [Candidatus Omnitrophica bacterium]|nr:glycosyltransferase family 2 protein [Candidatus Omnitrophota bacterium]
MKLIIQIPCFNEEKTLPEAFRDLPKKIAGIDEIEVLVVNDGSTDATVEIARGLGVRHIVDLPVNRGLAEAFRRGLDSSVEAGADIIVNIDGDNQYSGADIPKLIEPILEGKAEMVIGCRDIASISHFSPVKKWLQGIGSSVVRKFSKTDIPDTTSGFRAYSRDAAMRLNIFSNYTYTIESIIQAGLKELPITYVNISTNAKLRESRLIKSVPSYIKRSVVTMLRIYMMYEPLKSFVKLSLIPIFAGLFLVARFLAAHFTRHQGGHVQSLIIASACLITGFMIIMIGLLGDIMSANRKLNEEILYRLKKNFYDKKKKG